MSDEMGGFRRILTTLNSPAHSLLARKTSWFDNKRQEKSDALRSKTRSKSGQNIGFLRPTRLEWVAQKG
jgi:hypothetical protein